MGEYKIYKDYPAPGKKRSSLIGYEERDEEGFLWLSTFETAQKGTRKCEENADSEKGNDYFFKSPLYSGNSEDQKSTNMHKYA